MLGALPEGFVLCPVCQARAYRGSAPSCPDCPAPSPAPPAGSGPVQTSVTVPRSRPKPGQVPAPPRPRTGRPSPAAGTRERAQARADRAAPATAQPGQQPVRFVVPGRPVPKGRPRVVQRTDTGLDGAEQTRTVAYTPAATAGWEATVREVAGLTVRQPLNGPVSVELEFVGASTNADLDNLAKAVLDGLNGVVFDDDRQVDRLLVVRSRNRGRDAGVTVTVVPQEL